MSDDWFDQFDSSNPAAAPAPQAPAQPVSNPFAGASQGRGPRPSPFGATAAGGVRPGGAVAGGVVPPQPGIGAVLPPQPGSAYNAGGGMPVLPPQPQQPQQQQWQQQPQQPQQQQWQQQQQPQQPQQQLQQQQQQWQQQQPQQPQQQPQQPQQPHAGPAGGAVLNPFAMQQATQAATAMAAQQFGVNEAVAGAVMNQFGAQIQSSGITKWMPGVTMALRRYFNVSHSFVFRKILLLLFPFRGLLKTGQGNSDAYQKTMWAQNDQSPGGGQSPQGGHPSRQEITDAEGLKTDVEDPDLYVPLMAYTTYVLLYGASKGTRGEFHPEMLSSTATFAMVLLVLEGGAAKLGFYLAGATTVSTLDLFANCGYKYVNLALMVAAKMLLGGGYAYHAVFFYASACAGGGVYRFLRHLGPSQSAATNQGYGQQTTASTMFFTQVVLAITIAQLPLCWLMTPSLGSLSAAADVPAANVPRGA